MKKILLVGLFLSILITLTGCVPGSSETGGGTGSLTGVTGIPGIPETAQCYQIEDGASFALSGKRYYRVFKDALIPRYKVGVTTRKECTVVNHDGGKCAPPRGSEVHYYPIGNWQNENMDIFRLVCLADPCPTAMTGGFSPNSQVPFDVYVDEDHKDDLPDFVEHCQPKGGSTLVMVPPAGSPQTEMPYPFFKKEDIDHSSWSSNYDEVKDELANYYVKVGTTKNIAKDAKQIGEITMSTASETKTYNVFFHLNAIYLKDGEEIFQYEGTDEIPQAQESEGKTLKLATLRFVSLSLWNWYTPECKPVIYFYPQKGQLFSLWVNPKGYLTLTEPEYKNGWENLWLKPSGQIFYQGKFYPYLHYEAMIGDFVPPKTGYVVKKENLPSFFDEILPRVGLNQKEAKDFKDYWLSRLKDFPYFQVSLLTNEEIEKIEPIVFSKNPDTFIRVRFYFKGLNSPIKISSPQIPSLPLRTGFVVVEWGGLYE